MTLKNSVQNRLQALSERGVIKTSWRFVCNMVRRFVEHDCQKSAAALTYMTLFAIVPLMTVVYAIFSMVPAFEGLAEQFQGVVFNNLVPEAAEEVEDYIDDFTEQARSLTAPGVGILVVTAYLMLTNIEKTFNTIWGVNRARHGLSSFLLYWAVLSIGPILVGAALVLSTYLLSLRFVDEFELLGITTILLRLSPFLLTAIAFTLLFVAVPNCRVPARFAAVGGAMTAVVFEVLKDVFGWVVAGSNIQVIYGAFAVVPLFLLWVNIMWMTILAGAILVRALAERDYMLEGGKPTDMVAILKCLALFYQRAKRGDAVSDTDCYRLGLGVVHWQRLRTKLERHHWIITTAKGSYVLCRDLSQVTLRDLADLVQLPLAGLYNELASEADTPWFEKYLALRAEVAEHVQEAFGVPVAQLLEMDQGRTERELERLSAIQQPLDSET